MCRLTNDMESDDLPAYQLRRIGKPATVVGVKDVLKLKGDVTRFGRHSGNDYYLDSSYLVHFISRWHAEVHRVHQGDDVRYMMRDNSLNGTYVNEVRVQGNLLLEEGDHVVFGHINGKNIKAGEFAKQTESEFHFVFEKENSSSSGASCITTSQADSTATPGSPVLPVIGQSNAAAAGSDVAQDLTHRLVSSAGQAGLAPPTAGPAASTTNVDDKHMVLKDISNTGCSGQGLVPLDSLIQAQTAPEAGLQRHTSVNDSQEEEAEVFRQACRSADRFMQDSDDDIFSLSQKDHETTNPAFQNISATAPMLSMRVGTPGDKSMNSSIGTLQVTTTTPHLDREPEQPRPSKQKTKKSRSNSDEYDDFVTSTRSDNESLASTTSLNLSQPPPPSSKHKTKTVKRKSQVQPPKGKAKGTRGAKTPTSSTTAKRRKTDKGGPKPKGSSVAEDSPEDSSEDEEYKYHQDDEECSSDNCKRPRHSKISWVQCDSCDEWYHTVCVGVNYKQLKDDTEFHCGC